MSDVSMRTILLLSKGSAINPATRYRYLQYKPFWTSRNYKVHVRPLFDDNYYKLKQTQKGLQWASRMGHYAINRLSKRTKDLEEASNYDLILLENQVFPYEQGSLDRRLIELNHNVILEFDDAIYLTPLHRKKLEKILPEMKHVIVGNRFLADFALEYTDNVSIIPTVVDTSRYDPTPKEPGKRIVIGWIGLPVNLPNLSVMEQAVAKVAEEFDVEFRVISSQPHVLPGVKCTFVPWSEETEVQALADIDIGIMPLPDNEWSRGKCGLKVLQYMAAGRPAVVTPVGVNADIVGDCTTGFWASTPQHWYRGLRRLCADADLRQAMGQMGRKKVEQDFSLDTWGPRLMDLYQQIMDS